jgi:hypothetical protein
MDPAIIAVIGPVPWGAETVGGFRATADAADAAAARGRCSRRSPLAVSE